MIWALWASTWEMRVEVELESWIYILYLYSNSICMLMEYFEAWCWLKALLNEVEGPFRLWQIAFVGSRLLNQACLPFAYIASFKLWACDDCSQLMNKNMAPHSSSFKEVVMWYVCTRLLLIMWASFKLVFKMSYKSHQNTIYITYA